MELGFSMGGQYPAGTDMQDTIARACKVARVADGPGYCYLTRGQHYSAAPLQVLKGIPLHKPLDIAEQLIDYKRRLGENVIIPAFQWVGTPRQQVMDSLHIFAEEVMPRVRQGL